MIRVAVTGATGFIGRHAVAALQGAGFDAIGLTRQSAGAIARNCVPVDYQSSIDTRRALSRVDTVVHIAGLAHRPASETGHDAFQEANVELAARVANAARQEGARRFVLLSSAGVLGSASPAGGFSDDSVPAPFDEYTESKRRAELLLTSFHGPTFEVAVLRPPMVYGPGAPGTFARLVRLLELGWPLPLARLTTRRSVIGMRNLASAIVKTVQAPRVVPDAMLVADRDPVTVPDFFARMAAAAGRPARMLPVPVAVLATMLRIAGRQDDFRRMFGDFVLRPSRIERVLGWQAPYSTDAELGWACGRGAGVAYAPDVSDTPR